MENILQSILKQLNVKHNNFFTKDYFNTNPSNNSLWGISRMLTEYGIENVAIKIEDKSKISDLSLPHISHVNNEFVVVRQVDKDKIHFIKNGKSFSLASNIFFDSWSGIILLTESTNSSIEPNYKEHRKKTTIYNSLKYITIILVALSLLINLLSQKPHLHTEVLLLLFSNIAGLLVGFLILNKELNLGNQIGNRICSLIKGGSCNIIANRKSSKFMGYISWSEIGIAYFLSNILSIILLPKSIHVLAVINLLALPYTIWSIWYQKIVSKQWCILCLLTQVILWISFIISTIWNLISFRTIVITDFIHTISIYPITLLIIDLYANYIKNKIETNRTKLMLNTLKYEKDIFQYKLKKEAYYQNITAASNIILGNSDSEHLITIFSNPHCTPCADLEDTISLILKNTPCKVQYIFTSSKNNLKDSSKILISALINTTTNNKHSTIKEWYNEGRFAPPQFISKYNVNINDQLVIEEYEKHELFSRLCGFDSTPTILFNGYKIPGIFSLNDIYNIYKH